MTIIKFRDEGHYTFVRLEMQAPDVNINTASYFETGKPDSLVSALRKIADSIEASIARRSHGKVHSLQS